MNSDRAVYATPHRVEASEPFFWSSSAGGQSAGVTEDGLCAASCGHLDQFLFRPILRRYELSLALRYRIQATTLILCGCHEAGRTYSSLIP